ncbi:LacI family DNA-binding transcriptional regulator [Bosea vestrisii]|uniref:LacI family DNA-binding transcriptional regulator n=1 Tax=Bosea vestrisii TaxID=151416 RepID=UPI0024E01417|nr:LacI family DNA-binding transcriptional regulator [Bosea vestrisii]WID95037.1 LacI family DNA-binding transcriptional regulator [Bosea vestrisii]
MQDTPIAAPTIAEVARLAGVSTATVSRALAQPEKVKARTRERVLDAVKATGFIPNAQARNLRLQATRTVILLVRDISNPFYLEIYKGVEEAAIDAGYKVLMGDARDDDERILRYVDMVRERHADGLILMVGRFPEALAARGRLPPIVVALEMLPGLNLPTVKVDNHAAARAAVAHLARLGHRRIAHIAGPMPDPMSVDRRDGYLAGLADAGIAADPRLVVEGDFGLAAGRAAIRTLDAGGVDYTAVFAASDQMAVGAMGELRARGRNVPDDVSVVGFDDIVLAEAVEPQLTTVHQPRREIGQAAMVLLIAQLSGQGDRSDLVLPTRLVERASTAAPRKEGGKPG